LGSALSDVGLVVVGLQEVEMGAGVLAMAAAKESVRLLYLTLVISFLAMHFSSIKQEYIIHIRNGYKKKLKKKFCF